MDNITVTEKHALCMLKEVKKFSDMELSAHLVVSMVVEMMLEGSLEIVADKKKKWEIIKDIKVKLNNKLPKDEYNRALYKIIEELNKPEIAISQIIEKLCYSFTDKKYMKVIQPLQDKMINDKLISLENKKGLFKEKEVIVINEEEFNNTIGKIRTEFLEKGNFTDEFILLISLLNSTNFLKNIFIKYEKETLKKRLKEIKETEISKQVNIAREIIDVINTALIID